jgi:hypothetical protein
VTNGWHYAEGGKAVGPLDSKEMQVILSKISDPRNLQVWKVGFKGWERAGNVPELAELIHEPPPLPHEPPPLPQMPRHKRWASQGVWHSAAAIGVFVAIGLVLSGIGGALGALLLGVALDWATRRRRQFVQRLRQDIERRMMAAR